MSTSIAGGSRKTKWSFKSVFLFILGILAAAGFILFTIQFFTGFLGNKVPGFFMGWNAFAVAALLLVLCVIPVLFFLNRKHQNSQNSFNITTQFMLSVLLITCLTAIVFAGLQLATAAKAIFIDASILVFGMTASASFFCLFFLILILLWLSDNLFVSEKQYSSLYSEADVSVTENNILNNDPKANNQTLLTDEELKKEFDDFKEEELNIIDQKKHKPIKLQQLFAVRIPNSDGITSFMTIGSKIANKKDNTVFSEHAYIRRQGDLITLFISKYFKKVFEHYIDLLESTIRDACVAYTQKPVRFSKTVVFTDLSLEKKKLMNKKKDTCLDIVPEDKIVSAVECNSEIPKANQSSYFSIYNERSYSDAKKIFSLLLFDEKSFISLKEAKILIKYLGVSTVLSYAKNPQNYSYIIGPTPDAFNQDNLINKELRLPVSLRVYDGVRETTLHNPIKDYFIVIKPVNGKTRIYINSPIEKYEKVHEIVMDGLRKTIKLLCLNFANLDSNPLFKNRCRMFQKPNAKEYLVPYEHGKLRSIR